VRPRKLLTTFAFSFLIIAAALGWMARSHVGFDREWRVSLAIVCFGLGVWGVRERHRQNRNWPES